MPTPVHNQLTRSDAWAAGIVPADLTSLEAKIAQGVNGDLGGTWCPSYYAINVGGMGLSVTGPSVVFGPSGLFTFTGTGNYVLASGDFPQLGVGHSGRTQARISGPLASSSLPIWAGAVSPAYMSLQGLAPVIGGSPVQHVIPLFARDGATLSSVTLNIVVPVVHSALPPTMPKVRIVRTDMYGRVSFCTSVAAGANVQGDYSLPAPANAALWFGAQSFNIPVDQNTSVDNSKYLFYAVITDEAGLSGFPFSAPSTFANFATTVALTSLSGAGQTIDGYVAAAGSRVLVKNQLDPAQNGVWIVTAGAWTRANDAFTPTQMGQGQLVYVLTGITQGGSVWQQQTAGVTAVTGYQSWAPATAYRVGDGVSPIAQTTNVYGVAGIAVVNGGSGYTTTPSTQNGQLTITGACTTPAQAHCDMAYTISGVTNLVGGAGYSSPPLVTAVGTSGQHATLTATLGAFTYGCTGVNMTSKGAGYFIGKINVPVPGGTLLIDYGTVVPTVAFTGSTTGDDARGVAQYGTDPVTGIPNDCIVGVTITYPGSNYPPGGCTVTFTSGAYVDAFGNTNAAGAGAAGTAVLNNAIGSVVGVVLGSSTSGWLSQPTLLFVGGGGSGASAQAVMSGAIADIVIDNPGAGYTAIPTVAVTGNAVIGPATLLAPSVNTSPKPATGLYFVAQSVSGTGTSGGVQPIWPTQAGQTVVDDVGANQIVWVAQPDPGAMFQYTQPTAYGTVILGLSLNFIGIVDTRWE